MKHSIGIMGLGRMGAQIARRLHAQGFNVIAWNRSEGPREEFSKFGGQVAESPQKLINQLTTRPKIIWLMLPSGELIDQILFRGSSTGSDTNPSYSLSLSKGDIVIDGGNSFYRDSQRRANELARHKIHFFDCGTSGGIHGEKNGFSIMVGGPKEAWPQVEPIFAALAAGDHLSSNFSPRQERRTDPAPSSPGEGRMVRQQSDQERSNLSYGLVGRAGAGHFVKMIHNGIEYGMMEAIAEGFAVLAASEFKLDHAQIAGIWSRGSVVSSWLVELAKNIFETEDLNKVVGQISHTGEGEWTIKEAKRLGVDVRVIEDAFKVREESSDLKNQKKFSNKIVALLRKQFGGHEVKYKNSK